MARALTGDENGFPTVKSKIHTEMENNIAFYVETSEQDFIIPSTKSPKACQVCGQKDETGKNLGSNKMTTRNYKELMKKYKVQSCKRKFKNESPGIVELSAAAAYYHFQFILFDVTETIDSQNNKILVTATKFGSDPLMWKKIHASSVPQRVRHYFLRTGVSNSDWCYEYIVPIG